MSEPGPTVAELISRIEQAYPPSSAESWDQVGLSVGDPGARVEAVLLTVDVTPAVVAEAIGRGVGLIVSHHPLLLKGLHAVRADEPKGAMITELITHRIALYTAHTNADIAVDGTAAALAERLGLIDPRPLVPVEVGPLDKLTVSVPEHRAESLLAALSAAGAGAIGPYERAAFVTAGTGTFRPLPGAEPFLGRVGEIERVAETRLEMIMDRRRRRAVENALLRTHPYQTPAYDIVEVVTPSPGPTGGTGLGRVGAVTPCSLGEFAASVAARVPCGAGAVRVAGDPDRAVRTVALQAGAGDDLFDQARAAGADVYLTSDLRHHPASEALAWADAPALIDLPHSVAESLWLPRLAEVIIDNGAGKENAQDSRTPTVSISEVSTDPWTMRI